MAVPPVPGAYRADQCLAGVSAHQPDVILYFVWAIIYFQQIDVAVVRIAVAIFCSGVLYILFQTVFKESVDLSESEAFRRVARGLRNPRRIRDAQLRISFLTLSVMLFYVILILWRGYGISMSLFLRLPDRRPTTILICPRLRPAPARASEVESLVARPGSGANAGRGIACTRLVGSAP
jgi:hypothetical protein